MGNSVKEWLRQVRNPDGPEGDLIADMRKDETVPALFRNIREMRLHLQSRGACQEAIAAVPRVWRRYSRWLMRHAAGGTC
jgi:hypothetical protein